MARKQNRILFFPLRTQSSTGEDRLSIMAGPSAHWLEWVLSYSSFGHWTKRTVPEWGRAGFSSYEDCVRELKRREYGRDTGEVS